MHLLNFNYLYSRAICPVSPNTAAADVIATDEVYEKEMPSTTVVYELQGEGEGAKFVAIKQDCHQRLSKEMLDTTKVSQ